MADDSPYIDSVTGTINSLLAEAKPTGERWAWAFSQMVGGAEELNKTLGQGRERIGELMVAVSEATPAIDRLGGDLKNAVETIQDISFATSRSVIASSDEVSKLYSASKLLGKNVSTIVSGFQDVGVQFSQVGVQLEESLQYVQNVGGNAGQIMGKVLDDISALNKYNFENGVLGLTKMATQASILKFDMRETFNLADRAMDPEGAIQLSSAFQRLGVAAGDLTDPFQLMYKSLNDPAGLQNSLVEMTKQFTYFDEKTKSFRINPAGILTIKEIASQAQMSSSELSKMALNAADLDKKLSQIKPSITFENEDDKMYLANIAKMGQGGEYEVTVNDKETKKLQDVTQDEFNKLIKQQKEGPKTLEDIQKAQLDAFTDVRGNVRAIRDKFLFGVVSSDTVRGEAEGINRLIRKFTEKPERELNEKYFRDKAQGGMDSVKDILSAISKGENLTPIMEKTFNSAFKTMVEAGEKVDEGTKNIINGLIDDVSRSNNTFVEKSALKILEGMKKDMDSKTPAAKKETASTTPSVTALSKSFESGTDNIATKVNDTNVLAKESNNKLGEIAKNTAINPKVPVGISGDISSVFKVSSATVASQVGITNDLTKESNNRLNDIAKNTDKGSVGTPNDISSTFKTSSATIAGLTEKTNNILSEIAKNIKGPVGSTVNKDTVLNIKKPTTDDGLISTAKFSSNQIPTNNYAINASYRPTDESTFVRKRPLEILNPNNDVQNKKDTIISGANNELNSNKVNTDFNKELTESIGDLSKSMTEMVENFIGSIKGQSGIVPSNDNGVNKINNSTGLQSLNNPDTKVSGKKNELSIAKDNTDYNQVLTESIRDISETVKGLMGQRKEQSGIATSNENDINKINNIGSNEELTKVVGDISKLLISFKENITKPSDNLNTVTSNLIKESGLVKSEDKKINENVKSGQVVKLESIPSPRSEGSKLSEGTPTNKDSSKNAESHTHTFDGNITWKIDAPPELDTKRFYAMIDKQEFKEAFYKIVLDKFKETEQTLFSNKA
jgi:hypothetical protein